ncbi:hypothetical protein [Flavivirga rizhaonensis]|uniref:SGNH/GDSL hydrolase family protein n=1 Tax=Flavivirga rizhaonensis TaxID=2559571 RepID=A0A4S1E1K6_9FLAO|nr:hypothetical protein [Flavivirga rizhaonensis]TGV04430.1 hypothetical protein EM932_02585 [Flavivirga rizhaonensis]
MTQFFKYIIGVILIVLASLYVADKVYTHINSVYYSDTKFQFIRSFQDKKVDYIFLGSSRVENGINPLVIDSITGGHAVNFAVQSSKISDMLLILKLLDEYNVSYQKVFIQIDYIYNFQNQYSNVLDYELIPFYNSNKVIQNHLDKSNKFNSFEFSFPFMRYALYDQKNGFRRLVSNFKKSPSAFSYNNGFKELHGTSSKNTHDLPSYIIENNSDFENLKAYIFKNKINASYFCSPIRRDTKNLDFIDKLTQKIPDLINYTGIIKNEAYFIDNIHLNEKGAYKFSEIFANYILNQSY